MKRSDVTWLPNPSEQDLPSLMATIIDKDGFEWEATITQQPIGSHGPRFNTTLLCRTMGRMASTGMPQSITEAQEWCYDIIGIK